MRRGLERQTLGFEIDRVEVLRSRAIAAPPEPAAFCMALQGSQLVGWQRRGKYLIASLSRPGPSGAADAGHWGVHLRMTGQFLWLDDQTTYITHQRNLM